MNYTVKPREYKFRKVKEQVEEVLETYSYCMKIEDFDVNLGWQDFDESVSFTNSDSSITLIINPDRELEGLERTLMLAVFHLEFRQKSVYDHIEFSWQEVAEFAYASVREENILGSEDDSELEELREKWPDLKESLKDQGDDFDEEMYRNVGSLGEAIGRHLSDELEPEELLKLKRSDIIEAGDELFD